MLSKSPASSNTEQKGNSALRNWLVLAIFCLGISAIGEEKKTDEISTSGDTQQTAKKTQPLPNFQIRLSLGSTLQPKPHKQQEGRANSPTNTSYQNSFPVFQSAQQLENSLGTNRYEELVVSTGDFFSWHEENQPSPFLEYPESDPLQGVLKRSMGRFLDNRSGFRPWRDNLGQRIKKIFKSFSPKRTEAFSDEQTIQHLGTIQSTSSPVYDKNTRLQKNQLSFTDSSQLKEGGINFSLDTKLKLSSNTQINLRPKFKIPAGEKLRISLGLSFEALAGKIQDYRLKLNNLFGEKFRSSHLEIRYHLETGDVNDSSQSYERNDQFSLRFGGRF